MILTNHSNSERPYLSKVLRKWLLDELNGNVKDLERSDPKSGEWEVLVSKADRDPLRTV